MADKIKKMLEKKGEKHEVMSIKDDQDKMPFEFWKVEKNSIMKVTDLDA